MVFPTTFLETCIVPDYYQDQNGQNSNQISDQNNLQIIKNLYQESSNQKEKNQKINVFYSNHTLKKRNLNKQDSEYHYDTSFNNTEFMYSK